MVVKFQTQPEGNRVFRNARQIEETQFKMESFADYLKNKYEYISKMDMLTQEKEARQAHGLTVGQAAKVWNKIYGS